MSSAVSKLAALNAGLLRFCIQHSDFNAVENPDNLPQRPQADYDWYFILHRFSLGLFKEGSCVGEGGRRR